MSRPALLDDPALLPILAALPRARLVGGCVRDMLAGRDVADIDLATPDTPDAILVALNEAGLRAVPTGLAHGTVTAISQGRSFEITTLRRDEETDGRHARVAWTDDFTEDAARRDFTINAMSLDRSGTLHDPFGGQADLASGRVRFVGAAALRIAEDHLRILRFFRFFARYGAEPPDSEATAAIGGAVGSLAALSAERVWSELKRILAVPDPRPALRLMERLGVLAAILPEAGPPARLDGLQEHNAPPDPILRLAVLLTGAAGHLPERLKLSGAERDRLAGLLAGPAPDPADDDDALRRKLAETEPALLIGRAWRVHPQADALRARLSAMPRPVFPLEGRHALALGWSPGPDLGRALREVRGWWLQGGCVASFAQCEARLREARERDG
jgi:poly(A) polymerase/tRNA nucleotidyltransferase (CCA-adding enzyme)